MAPRFASQPPRDRAQLWTWLVALLLLSLLVWVVGRRVERGKHPEIGVTGDRAVPLVVAPSPTPVGALVERPPPISDRPAAPAEGGEPAQTDSAPASPSPRR